MTRAELIDLLSLQFPDENPKLIDYAVREIFEIMIETLAAGDRIEIRGFGSFEIRVREPRVAHNPKTGQPVALDKRRVVHFKPGVELRNRVNIKPLDEADLKSPQSISEIE